MMKSRRNKFALLSTTLVAGLLGVSTHSAIAQSRPVQPSSPVLIATAYTDLTLPTLRQGDRGRDVELLQQILLDNGFLGAAGVRLGNPSGATLDGVFGPITASAVSDLQRRYEVPVTGQVNPRTWEVIDTQENPYRSPLPWKQ
jgi:peptidoglycan hydrolase-like protein with peptidoglycan-binding domain